MKQHFDNGEYKYRFPDHRSTFQCRQSVIEECEFKREVFVGCDFESTIIKRTKFPLCSFKDCNFKSAQFEYVVFAGHETVFTSCVFDECVAVKFVAPNARFERCSFRKASFGGADIQDAQFIDCNFELSDFSRSDFMSTSFRNADLSGVVFREACLFGADFTDAILAGADLGDSNVAHALITVEQLKSAKLAGKDESRRSWVRSHVNADGSIKKSYSTVDAANDAKRRYESQYPQEKVGVYVCKVCKSYHLGHIT